MFDCVMPTRNARNGCYLRLTVRLTSKNKNGRMIFPIDEMAITYVDTEYTKAYLRHLFAANEYLGNKLLPSIILVLYVVGREARKHILAAISELGKK
jgi:queuine tRNA-ribosyltransferase